MKKINKKNVGVLVLFIMSASMVFLDILTLLLETFRGNMVGWTTWGAFTFVGACFVANMALNYIIDKLNDEK